MPPSIASMTSRRAASAAATPGGILRCSLIAALHGAAFLLMLWSEAAVLPKVVFCLTWGLINFFWLAVLRRPAVSAALSLAMIVVLILLSRLKYEIIRLTANFLDVVIINSDTVDFLLAIKPDLYGEVLFVLALVLPALTLLWWVDTFRVRLRTAAMGFAACAAGLVAMPHAVPQ